ncbi:MAG: cyclodeaminase/cyclohydrolase family protein [Thermoplasmata archaeon]
MESYDEFIKRLASPSPAPGGGAASAFVSIVSGALVSMVSALTIGKKGYENYYDEIKKIESEVDETTKELRNLMAKDEAAFNILMAAYKLPKGTDEEKKKREDEIQKAVKGAIDVPWSIAYKAYDILKLTKFLADHGNKSAITDTATGALLSHAAVKAAIYNVRINLKSVKDKDYVADQNIKMKLFLENCDEVYNSVIKTVEGYL